jgi:hypothetical protein
MAVRPSRRFIQTRYEIVLSLIISGFLFFRHITLEKRIFVFCRVIFHGILGIHSKELCDVYATHAPLYKALKTVYYNPFILSLCYERTFDERDGTCCLTIEETLFSNDSTRFT